MSHDELFDISAFAAEDSSEMVVEHPITGEPTSWKITFAGPGHPTTVAQSDKIARQSIRDAKEREMAQVNGRKWKGEDRTPEDNRKRNAEFFAGRMLSWTPVKINGERLEFSHDNAVKILIDPHYVNLYIQITNFLADERSFTKASATA